MAPPPPTPALDLANFNLNLLLALDGLLRERSVTAAAKRVRGSPIYGMPILEVERARVVIVCKRSLNPGFAGIDNELYYSDNTLMLFGDAKETMVKLAAALKET